MILRRALVTAFLPLLLSAPAAAAATPFIQSLSPPAVPPGAGPLALTVYGANFSPSAKVAFAGQSLTPNAVTPNRIAVTIPASSLSRPGSVYVVVMNPALAGTTSASKPVPFGIVNPSRNVSVGPAAGPSLSSTGRIVSADFNGDGKPDLAITDFGASAINVYLGDGGGNFGPGLSLNNVCMRSLGMSPIVVDDFNGDGKPDIAAICGSGLFSVLLGNGAGGFTVINRTMPPNWGFPSSVGSGDFNRDGHPDLAFAGDRSAVILMGDGTGNFTLGASPPPFADAFSVAVGDFNNDGNLDFALSSEDIRSPMILFGDGAGNFSLASSLAILKRSIIRAGDFNNDGNLDLVLSPSFGIGGTGVVLLGNGSGQFTVSASLDLKASNPSVADFNGDGNLDIAFSNGVPLEIFLGDGKGGFYETLRTSPFSINFGNEPIAGDFNGDGLLDFALNLFGQSEIRLQQPNAAPGSYNIADLCAPANCTLFVLSNGGPYAAGLSIAVQTDFLFGGVSHFPGSPGFSFMPYSINRFGAIAGATVGPDSSLATLWTVSQPFGPNLFDLSSVEPSSTEATYVNDRNQIVGDSNGLRPVVGLIPGVPLSRVYALTENGVVLGADIRGPLAWTPQSGISYLNRPDGVPVLLSGGAFNSLGQVLLTAPSIGRLFTPGVGAFDQPSAPGFTVRGFNSEGQFVGLQGGGPAPAPSIYTTGGGVVALSSLLPPGNGWTLTDATAVNDNGQILVLATKGSRNTTLLLTPSHMSLPPTLRQTPQTRECVSASFNLSARSVLPCRDPLAGKKDRK